MSIQPKWLVKILNGEKTSRLEKQCLNANCRLMCIYIARKVKK